MLILLAFLSLEIVLLYRTMKRSGFVPFPHLLLGYLMGCQISIYLVHSKIAKYNFLRTYSNYSFSSHYTASQILFFVTFLFTFLLFSPRRNVKFAAQLRQTLQSNVATFGILMVVACLWMYHLILIISLNFDLVWRNYVYLLMNDYRVLDNNNGFTRFILSALPLVGFLVFAIAAIFAWRRERYIAYALFPLAAFDYLYQAGAHSRRAVMYLLVFAITSAVLRGRRSVVLSVIAASMFTLIFCLGGRQYGIHGISSFMYTPEIFSYYARSDQAEVFFNIFEGGFATTELFTRQNTASFAYKFLSFSPLPSLIDGFDQIRAANMQRLGPYAPPSAIFEAWSFGLPYVVLLLLPQVIAGRLTVKLVSERRTTIGVAANLLMAFATYVEFTYPIRTTYRYFLIALVLAIIGTMASRNQRPSGRRAVRERPGERARGARIARVAEIGAGR